MQVEQLIKILENKHNYIRVTKVLFLKKKDKGDGFKKFNYKDLKGGRNDVSFTVVVNLGKLNDTSEIATIDTSQSNKEPSVLTGSRREVMMQKLSLQEKEEINRLPKEVLYCLQLQMLNTKDINYSMDYLQEQNEIMCRKVHVKSHPYSTKLVLSHLTQKITPNVEQQLQGVLEGKTSSIRGIS